MKRIKISARRKYFRKMSSMLGIYSFFLWMSDSFLIIAFQCNLWLSPSLFVSTCLCQFQPATWKLQIESGWTEPSIKIQQSFVTRLMWKGKEAKSTDSVMFPVDRTHLHTVAVHLKVWCGSILGRACDEGQITALANCWVFYVFFFF